MGFEAMASETSAVPAIPREIGKKKRANRSAKLKQCKLDARREQWLSQVKNKGKNTNVANPPTLHPQQISEGISSGREQSSQDTVTTLENDRSSVHDSSEAESVGDHLCGNPSRKDIPVNNSISSSGSSIGSCSRSVSDAEEEEEEMREEGASLDDWEAVADALSESPGNSQEHHSKSPGSLADTVIKSANINQRTSESIKHETNRTTPRAWRPDDAFRPQSLPNLSKQLTFPGSMEKHYGAHNCRGLLSPPPSSCPICFEDLDLTDSSFLPCTCGFHLCLFCHKRILEADGRCPGCRKQYNVVMSGENINTITGVGVPLMAHRFSRSCSMSSRS